MAFAEKRKGGYIGRYRDADGVKRTIPGIYTAKSEALRDAAEEEAKSRRHGWIDPKGARMTWAEWCEEWWPTRSASAATLKDEVYIRDGRLLPRFGKIELGNITPHEIRKWTAEMRKEGRAPSTIHRYANVLSVSMSGAVDAGLIATNPVARVKIERQRVSAERYLTREEFAAIADELKGGDLAVANFLVGTGVRWGELAGLHTTRLDRKRGNVRVIDAWVGKTRAINPYPKGKRIREVPVPDWVLESLKPQLQRELTCGYRHSAGRCEGALVFYGVLGGVMDVATWTKRVWAPAVARADVGHVRVHDLRHTYASWLLQDGVSLAEVGRLLGHMDPSTTQRYAHLAETNRSQILAAMRKPGGQAVGRAVSGETRLRPTM
ncbi:tyrosine-type recombinase/integrase [Pseudoclavibacter helvolus]|uniref:tyrosine-type recombinase/integrase n=1 Tax=Pseudoclavibacter helvolus TaxID=255205 RepID=UPI003C741BE9